jgi:septin 3/9/12
LHGQQVVAIIDSTYVLTRTSTPSSLKPIDIVVLKKLSDVVNVVPVIAKADSLTLEERQAFKERIKEEFAFHNLKMYPYDNDELDDEERAINAQIKVCDCTSLSKTIRL